MGVGFVSWGEPQSYTHVVPSVTLPGVWGLLIVPQETGRKGRLPERTVYRLTGVGRIELHDWLTELLSTPVKDYTSFEAALSFLPTLPPEDVASLLRGGRQARGQDYLMTPR